MKKIYIAMSADLIHTGHINIIKEAKKLGKVTIGLLNDKAIASYKRIPYTTYEERFEVLNNIKGVSKVIEQKTLDYTDNLLLLKPDFVLHGDDWKEGIQFETRNNVQKILNGWGGKIIDIPYTSGISSTKLNKALTELGTTPDIRRNMLRRLIHSKKIVRILESHSALSGLIVEKLVVNDNLTFDGMWSSSLTDSISKGKPDIEAVDLTARLNTINEIFEVTTKPLIFDADTGGLSEHFNFTVRSLERLGVSAVVIEDKIGLKRNSLFGTSVEQTQDTIENFSRKISSGVKSKITNEFMIIARIESLILGKGMDDAINRAFSYVKAGADGILIHSRSKTPDEILEFCSIFRKEYPHVPIAVVPTSYNQITCEELSNSGVNIVIYANHMLRASYPAMNDVAKSILTFDRSYEVENSLLSIKDILTLIPGT